MYTKLEYIAKNGETLDLFNDKYFDLVNVDGLTSSNVTIATATTPTVDGDTVNNVQANPRAITLDLHVKSDVDVEVCKRHILNVVKIKQTATLRYTQGTGTEQRIIEIAGVVQSIELPRFNNNCQMQISMYCSNSFWEDVNEIVVEISRIIPKHHFPIAFPINNPIPLGVIDSDMRKSYVNDGDVETGLIITIIATGDVTNPVIYNENGDYIGVNDSLIANDKIVINTNKGNKTITKNGVSIINKIKAGSTFLQMATGDNIFTIDADAGESSMYFNITFKRRFV